MSVDIPSGLCADKGIALGASVKADLTVTFIGNKPGLYTGQGKEFSGHVEFVGLDVPSEVYRSVKAIGCRLSEFNLSPLIQPGARDGSRSLCHYGHRLSDGSDSASSTCCAV